MSTEAYVSFLAIGVVLVLVDGQIIYRSGRGYLESSYGDAAASASMTRLVTVLFHLVTLGLLALLSTIPLGDSDLPGVVGRIGVLLLVLAIVHAITLGVLGRIRGEQVGEAVVNRRLSRREAGQRAAPVTTTAVPSQEASYPDVSPPLEHRAP
ncbi:hypothetical protein [Amycolatopsis sp. NPDC051903]|uniref:hypothetical protein n=1 Tax=Amycolatopsis sp. NPDC051903 TaxID=3363936 RepID=UPI00378A6445